VGAGLDGRLRERKRGVEERTSAVDDHADAGDRSAQQVGIVDADHPLVEDGVPRRDLGEPLGAAAGEHGGHSAPKQLVDDEAPRVTGGAIDKDSISWVHETIVGRGPVQDECLKRRWPYSSRHAPDRPRHARLCDALRGRDRR